MFNISDLILDGADGANSAVADDNDNFMYESSDSETDCDWYIFRENYKLLLGQMYGIELTAMIKLTLNTNFDLFICACRRNICLEIF